MAVEHNVLFSGYARLPNEAVTGGTSNIMAMTVIVDTAEDTIVAVECTLSTRLEEQFVSSIMIGKNVCADAEAIVACFEAKYQSNVKKAVIAALRMIYRRYLAYGKQQEQTVVLL